MKKLLPIFLIFLAACAKEEMQPTETASQKTVEIASTSKVHVAINYSTTVTNNLSGADLSAQSLDTTYYEIRKNGSAIIKWKANWNLNSSYTIDDLNSIAPCNTGDVFECVVIHKPSRNIDSYLFNAGLSQNEKNRVVGMFNAGLAKPGQEFYDPAHKNFVIVMNLKVE